MERTTYMIGDPAAAVWLSMAGLPEDASGGDADCPSDDVLEALTLGRVKDMDGVGKPPPM